MIKIIALSLLLAGCATQSVFDPRACPVEKQYTKAEQQAILAAMPKTPPLIQKVVLVDYKKDREKMRACRGAK